VARSGLYGLGPSINDPLAYLAAAGQFSTVSTPSPAQGTYRLKGTGNGSANSLTWPIDGSTSFSLTYRWHCLREFRLDDGSGLTSSQEVGCLKFTPFLITWDYVSATTFNFRVYDFAANAYIGSAFGPYNVDQDYSLRFQTDGGSTLKIWVDGSLDFDESTAKEIQDNIMRFITGNAAETGNDLPTGQNHYWDGWYAGESNSESDRPGVTVVKYPLYPNANTIHGQYRQNGGSPGTAVYTDVDEWNGGTADGDTTYWEAQGGETKKQMSQMTTATVSNPANAIGVFISRARANIAAKTVTVDALIWDGTNTIAKQLSNLAGTTYRPHSKVFDTAPDSNPWATGDFDGSTVLRMGVQSPNTNGASDLHTALAMEVISIDDDPPAGGIGPQAYHHRHHNRAG